MKYSRHLLTVAGIFLLLIMIIAGCKKNNASDKYDSGIEERLIIKIYNSPDSVQEYINHYVNEDSISYRHGDYMNAFYYYYITHQKEKSQKILDKLISYYSSNPPESQEDKLLYCDVLFLTTENYFNSGIYSHALHYAKKTSEMCKTFNDNHAFIAADMDCTVGYIMVKMGKEKEGFKKMSQAIDFTDKSDSLIAFQAGLNCRSQMIALLYEKDSCQAIIKTCNDVIAKLDNLESITKLPESFMNTPEEIASFKGYYTGIFQAYLSSAYCIAGQPDSARVIAGKCLETPWGKKNRYTNLALIHTYAYLGMEESVDSALNVFIQTNGDDTIQLKMYAILECMAEAAERNHNMEKALYYYNRANRIHNKIYNEDVANQITVNTEQLNQTEKIKAENEMQKLKKSVWISHTVILVIVILSIILVYHHHQKNKQLKAAYKTLLDKQSVINANVRIVSEMASSTTDQNSILFDRILNEMKSSKPYLKEDFSINTLAEILNTNVNYISKAINYSSYKSFPQWLAEYRNQIAIQALQKNPNLTINDVCILTGHNTRETFSRQFKNLNGMSFSEFRSQTLKNNKA